jgi:hypothetical protein
MKRADVQERKTSRRREQEMGRGGRQSAASIGHEGGAIRFPYVEYQPNPDNKPNNNPGDKKHHRQDDG